MMQIKELNIGGSFPAALTLIFVVMKCMGYINWSWWLVFSPMIATVILTLSIFLLIVCICE